MSFQVSNYCIQFHFKKTDLDYLPGVVETETSEESRDTVEKSWNSPKFFTRTVNKKCHFIYFVSLHFTNQVLVFRSRVLDLKKSKTVWRNSSDDQWRRWKETDVKTLTKNVNRINSCFSMTRVQHSFSHVCVGRCVEFLVYET